MPSNIARALSATVVTRDRSKAPSYSNVTLTPITVPPFLGRPKSDAGLHNWSFPGGFWEVRPRISILALAGKEQGNRRTARLRLLRCPSPFTCYLGVGADSIRLIVANQA